MVLAVCEKTFTHEVLGSSTPVLVNFWAPWCGVCRMVSPLLTKLQSEWDGQIKIVSINADENLRLSNTYRLTTLPTVLLFNDGRLLHRLDHFRNPDDFRTAAQELQLALEALKSSYSYSL